jgi:hypothetical protein
MKKLNSNIVDAIYRVGIVDLWYDFTYFFKRKAYQIKRVIDFLPIIWRGYDFDYSYALELFKHQLQRMADHFESGKAYTTDAKERAKEIRLALKLMDIVQDEKYVKEIFDNLERLYGKLTFDTELIEDRPGVYQLKIRNLGAKDADHQKEIDALTGELLREARKKQKRAHHLLWKYIDHKINGWWS